MGRGESVQGVGMPFAGAYPETTYDRGAGACAPPSMPGLGEAFSELTKAQLRAEEVVEMLAKRLDPLCKPTPRLNEAVGNRPTPPCSPVAGSLLEIAARINMAINRLLDLDRNLDI